MEESTFSAKRIAQLRERVWKGIEFPESVPQGWSKSPVDPTRLLEGFEALRLRKGYTLHAYQFREGGNAAGYIWAMPADKPFPEPKHCEVKGRGILEPPRPAFALDNHMMVIDGDRTPWSYVQASIFHREALQLGAMWHGLDWSTYKIIDQNPIHPDVVMGYGKEELAYWRPEQWKTVRAGTRKGRVREPSDLKTGVTVLRDTVRVRFYTFSELINMSIYQHVDLYVPRTYVFLAKESVVATGPRGLTP
jgi:hypothetical protein